MDRKNLDSLFNQMVCQKSKVLWTFGYGSLIWKPGFNSSKRIVGFIKGYQRRFYQGTTTHRGTVEWPGRVATILKSDDPEERVWGTAYAVNDESEIEAALEHLAEREMITGGYHFDKTIFYPKSPDMAPVQMCVYVADAENSQFLGECSLEMQAYQIAIAKGVCGRNSEYVWKVVDFMQSEVAGGGGSLEELDPYLDRLTRLIGQYERKETVPCDSVLAVLPQLVARPAQDRMMLRNPSPAPSPQL